jgi:hypothetical protein
VTYSSGVCNIPLATLFFACLLIHFLFRHPETKFHVKPLPHARIPIVKLSLDPSPALPLGIACDIGFENRLALENTRLLYCYAMIDPTRVRTLVLFRESGILYSHHVDILIPDQSRCGVNEGSVCSCLCVSALRCLPTIPQKDKLPIQGDPVIIWIRALGHLLSSPCQASTRTSKFTTDATNASYFTCPSHVFAAFVCHSLMPTHRMILIWGVTILGMHFRWHWRPIS